RPDLDRAPLLLRDPHEKFPAVALRVVAVDDLVDVFRAAHDRLFANLPAGRAIRLQLDVDARESISSLRHVSPRRTYRTGPTPGLFSRATMCRTARRSAGPSMA